MHAVRIKQIIIDMDNLPHVTDDAGLGGCPLQRLSLGVEEAGLDPFLPSSCLSVRHTASPAPPSRDPGGQNLPVHCPQGPGFVQSSWSLKEMSPRSWCSPDAAQRRFVTAVWGWGSQGRGPAGHHPGCSFGRVGREVSHFLVPSSCRLSGFGKSWELKAHVVAVSSTPGVRPGGDLRSVEVSISCFNFGVSSLSKEDSEFSVPLKSFHFLKGRNPRSAHCQVAVLARRELSLPSSSLTNPHGTSALGQEPGLLGAAEPQLGALVTESGEPVTGSGADANEDQTDAQTSELRDPENA